MRKGFLGFAAVSLFLATASAAPNDIIVRYKNSEAAGANRALGMAVTKVLAEDLHIVLLTPQLQVLDSSKMLQILRADKNVRWAQLDHEVSLRETSPNDPDFTKQWALSGNPNADIRAPGAWDLGQGGKSAAGDDIVVAVVDQGLDVNHDSLKENIWVNQFEIPGNGIDDDNNGYIDDVHGWNAVTDVGTIPAEMHATHVAGIIGARGNDNLQTVGVNWNAKIMSVRALGNGGGKGLTSTVIDAYSYVIKQKKAWLESGGTKGANVVATNSSFGVDYAKCDSGEYPAWNDIYNAMGEVGILSVAATANLGIDVDARGDVPTTCSSEYIVAVTNTDAMGLKNNSAGYGLTNIDLGAPGTKILSTVPNQGLRELSGTSMATPHVTGAIEFLHSVASREFVAFSKANPAEAALAIKHILLSTVSPQADLAGRTVTGGRLNLSSSSAVISQFVAP